MKTKTMLAQSLPPQTIQSDMQGSEQRLIMDDGRLMRRYDETDIG